MKTGPALNPVENMLVISDATELPDELSRYTLYQCLYDPGSGEGLYFSPDETILAPVGNYNPQTADEKAVPVVPTNYGYKAYDPRRYGAVHDEDVGASGTDNSAAFTTAVSIGSQTIPVEFTGQVGDVTLKNSLDGRNIGKILPVDGAGAGDTVFKLVKNDNGWGDWHHLVFENIYIELLGDSQARLINGFQYPEIVEGTITSASTTQVIDSASKFQTGEYPVLVNDKVVNTTAGKEDHVWKVDSIVSDTTLNVSKVSGPMDATQDWDVNDTFLIINQEKTFAGRNVWRSVTISRADKAIYQPAGNFGNHLYHCVLKNGNYGIFGVETNTPHLMHPGMWHIYGGEISGNRKAGIYLNCDQESGNGLRFENVAIESNIGHGLYLDGWNLASDAPILEAVHFESNNLNGDDTIDLGFGRGVETIRDLMCHDVDHIRINNTAITATAGFEFNNSMAVLDGCFFNSSSLLQRSNDSVVRCINANLDGIHYLSDVIVESLTQQRRAATNGANMRCQVLPRDHIIYNLPGTGVSAWSEPNAEDAVNLGGSGGTGVRTKGGGHSGLYKYHNRYANFNTNTSYYGPLAAVTNGKWYVWTIEFMLEGAGTSDLDDLMFQHTTQTEFMVRGLERVVEENVDDGDWCTLGGVTEFTGTTGNMRFRVETTATSSPIINIGACQLIQFDTQWEAIEYFNSRAFYQDKVYEYGDTKSISATTTTLDFSTEGYDDQPDTDYIIELTNSASNPLWYTSKSTTGFTINQGSAVSGTCNWYVRRKGE